MDLKKLMTGSNPQTLMLEQTRGLKAKWEKTGLLENVGSETTKHGMAVMLENQAKQLLDEATRTGTSSGSEEWAGVALPLVRRIFGSIAAKEFVSVQPMNLPSGLIFYMDFKYGTNPAGNPDFTGSPPLAVISGVSENTDRSHGCSSPNAIEINDEATHVEVTVLASGHSVYVNQKPKRLVLKIRE